MGEGGGTLTPGLPNDDAERSGSLDAYREFPIAFTEEVHVAHPEAVEPFWVVLSFPSILLLRGGPQGKWPGDSGFQGEPLTCQKPEAKGKTRVLEVALSADS